MRIFIFKSDTNPGLQAFSDDQGGGKLPKQFRPWHAIGVIRRRGAASPQSEPRRDRGIDRQSRLSIVAHEKRKKSRPGLRHVAVELRSFPRMSLSG